MNLSLGEFRALVAKAFRGAGYSWGLTEDAAFASVCLAECGVDVGPAVVRLLHATEGQKPASLMPTETWECAGDILCPICVGTCIVDEGHCSNLSLERLAEPMFLAPFLLSVLDRQQERRDSADGFVVAWQGGRCDVANGTIVLTGSPVADGSTVTVTPQELSPGVEAPGNRADRCPRTSRVELDEATKTALEAFAHRTYAPATEASRLAGAGAGLLDDD